MGQIFLDQGGDIVVILSSRGLTFLMPHWQTFLINEIIKLFFNEKQWNLSIKNMNLKGGGCDFFYMHG